MESNVNPGKTNLRLANKASAILLAFEEGRSYFPDEVQDRIHVIGNPVRRQIEQIGTTAEAREAFGLDPNLTTILVFGGSLGAHAINHAVEEIMSRWVRTNQTPEYQIIWQTGRQYEANIPEPLTKFVQARQFVDDMGQAYAAADIVVSRSGATTLAELGALGKPAILIPLPSASTNEQQLNAEVAEKRGGAIVINNEEVDLVLADTLEAILIDPRRREAMGQKMATLATKNAAEEAAQIVMDLAK
jgi:UDP-N-acetylglucosamine--N-acetylmuramyl-(pentapeptide) pyrophosphoryl-undecaprenol N-acetylglucosamine transferase